MATKEILLTKYVVWLSDGERSSLPDAARRGAWLALRLAQGAGRLGMPGMRGPRRASRSSGSFWWHYRARPLRRRLRSLQAPRLSPGGVAAPRRKCFPPPSVGKRFSRGTLYSRESYRSNSTFTRARNAPLVRNGLGIVTLAKNRRFSSEFTSATRV